MEDGNQTPGSNLERTTTLGSRTMATGTIWIYDAENQLKPLTVEGEAVDVTARPPRALAGSPAAGAAPAALLLPARRGTPPPWVLLADGPVVMVNGERVVTGIRVLSDRDEIRVADNPPLWFSTETLPAVEPFPGADRAAYCPRCKLTIQPGAPAVRCPSCGVYHHQFEDRPCYTYAPSCAACGAPAELGGGYRWIPEEP